MVLAATTTALLASAVTADASSLTPLKGGTTTVMTGPGIATTLPKNRLFAYAVTPGRTGVTNNQDLALTFAFPVIGGKVGIKPLAEQVRHKGSTAFVNLANAIGEDGGGVHCFTQQLPKVV
ncbi:hypothetical protein [Actinomadura hibisca]|uniref:hypothetical protein n=1 Tax=Actinomadura hibisca TaxID=68565 RepID=UPI000833B7F6|nr:hypothetical protein [Actinomadura hibisca]